MPRFEIEIDDAGEMVGDTPEALNALFKKIETASYGQGFGKGSQKAAEEAKAQIEANVKAELQKREALLPAEREKWAKVEEDNKTLSSRLAELMREGDRTLKSREEVHAREILQRSEALKAREALVQNLVQDQIESYAVGLGARDESLAELRIVLKSYIAYDDDGKPYVASEAGGKEPRLLRGEPMPIKAFVRDYLETHPHHRTPTKGTGGGARGGATFAGRTGDTVSADAAKNRINAGDRTPGAINELFEATRRKAAS